MPDDGDRPLEDQPTERIGIDEPPIEAEQAPPARPPVAPDEPPAWVTVSAPTEPGAPASVSTPGAEPVRVPAPAPSAPISIKPRTLSKRRAHTLAAFADALLPPGGALPYGATEAGVAERLDAAIGSWDPGARTTFARALTLFDWSSVLSRHVFPFSRLKPPARAQYLERVSKSKMWPRSAAFKLLKRYTADQFCSTPRVEQHLGFSYGCVTTDAPPHVDKLEVLTGAQVARDHVEDCDVVVVGSGAGGAVVAKELAEVGLSVIVVEEGQSFTRDDFSGPPFERFQKMYRRQGMTVALGRPTIAMPMGMTVGGSTPVGHGTCFRTPDRVLQRWEKDHGLSGVDPASMRVFFERVEKIQHVKPVPDELLGENARTFRRGVQTLGLHGWPLQRAIEGCRGCGVCSFGCPTDANLSMHLTYLPRAQRHGATIYAGARATEILVERGRARGIRATMLDPRTRAPGATLTVNAKMVVLAAGAIHTPALLSHNALGDQSGMLGRNLRIHPTASVGAFFDEPIHAWRGTQQSFYVDDYHESNDVLIEVTAPVPGANAGRFPGTGSQLKEALARYAHFASAEVMVADTSEGRVRRRRGEPLVTYALNEHDARRIATGIVKTAEIFLAAGARGVVTGLPGVGVVTAKEQLDAVRQESLKPGSLSLHAYHPVGTARMGANRQASVVDEWGEVHGVAGLFVADASMLPSCPTVNPQITVMTFAMRTADHISRHAARYFA